MPRILISETIDPVCPRLFQAAGFEADVRPGLAAGELMEIIGGYEGLVVRGATRVTADLLAGAGALKIIGRAGAGVDTIDVGAATAAGIMVMNTPGQNANAVAELVFGLMFCLARHVDRASSSLKAGRWEKNRLAGTELRGKILGVIGYGAIGRRVGALAGGLGMSVLAYDPYLDAERVEAAGARPAGLDEIYAASDFLTLHLPGGRESANMIGAEVFMKMKPGAYLINCARGGLVDEAALAAALSGGRLAGAAMDVFAAEPPEAGNPLLALDNFIGTPHIGASTAESQVNVARAVARQMIAFFQSGALEGVVNV